MTTPRTHGSSYPDNANGDARVKLWVRHTRTWKRGPHEDLLLLLADLAHVYYTRLQVPKPPEDVFTKTWMAWWSDSQRAHQRSADARTQARKRRRGGHSGQPLFSVSGSFVFLHLTVLVVTTSSHECHAADTGPTWAPQHKTGSQCWARTFQAGSYHDDTALRMYPLWPAFHSDVKPTVARFFGVTWQKTSYFAWHHERPWR